MKEPRITVEPTIEGRPWRGSRVNVEWPERKFPLTIDVCPEQGDFRTEQRDAIIGYEANWPALGNQPPELTRLFAAALMASAEEAERLTKEYKGRNVYANPPSSQH